MLSKSRVCEYNGDIGINDCRMQANIKMLPEYIYFWYSNLLKSKYFFSSAGYLGGKFVFFSLFALGSQYLLAHNLSIESYGVIVWANTILSTLGFLSLPGLSQSLVSAVSKGFLGNYALAFKEKLVFSSLGALVISGVAGYYFYKGQQQLSLVMFFSSLFSFGLWMDLQEAFWNGKKEFKKIFLFSSGIKLLQLILLFVTFKFTSSVVVVFATQMFLGAFSNLAMSWHIARSYGANKPYSKEYHDYGKYLSWLGVLALTAGQVDKWVVKGIAGLNSLAVYAVGQLIYTYFMKVPAGIMASIFQPRLAGMSVRDAAKWLLVRQPIILFSLTCLVAVVALVLPFVYPVLFSEKYKGSIYYAYWFLACVAVSGPQMLIGTLLKAHTLKKEMFISQVLLSVAPFLAIPFGFLWGLDGVIWSRFVGMLALSVWYLFMVRHLANTNGFPSIRGLAA